MKTALITCPAWATGIPPYNIALLKAVLLKQGFDAACFDMNIELFAHISKKLGHAALEWETMSGGECWEHSDYVNDIFNDNMAFVADFLKKVYAYAPGIIAFSLYERNRYFTYLLTEKIKQDHPGIPVIYGGPDCYRYDDSDNARITESRADAVCFTEGELILPDLIRNYTAGSAKHVSGCSYKLANGSIITADDPPAIEDLDDLSFADFSDLDLNLYKPLKFPIMTSKSCINRCSFCSECRSMQKYRTRSAHSVYAEMRSQMSKYPVIKEFWFCDSLINGNIKELEILADLIINGNINIERWGGQAVIRKEMTPELLQKLRKAGCNSLGYGPESGSDHVLGLMKKNYDSKTAQRVMEDTYRAGISFSFNIIVGFPGETPDDFQQTLKLVRTNLPFAHSVNLNTLNVLPGTDIHYDPGKYGIKITDSNADSGWHTIDGTNDYKERLRRLNILQDAVKDKGMLPFNKEVQWLISLGDSCHAKNDVREARRHYSDALEKNCDTFIEKTIRNRLENLKN